MKKNLSTLLTLFVFTLLLNRSTYAQIGTWTAITNSAPNNCNGVMLLLTDGTAICKDDAGPGQGTGWNRLTPDNTGSYVNGTWTSIASMNRDRLFFASQVLPDGKVFAAGGEYGQGATHGEVYDPVANTWTNTNTVTNNQNIYDGNSEILATGVVLVGLQAGNNNGYDDLFYTEGTNNWTTAPQAPLDHDEAAWLKLPDASILFVGIGTQNSCRYIPASNTWVADGNLPVAIYDQYGSEMGGAYMLPNGKAVFFGATGHNVIYTPSGNTSPGTWIAAADFPVISGTQTGQVDAAGAMMVNGHILLAVSPVNSSHNDQFRSPFWFVEYDYITNAFTQVTSIIPIVGADSIAGVPCNFSNMLDLPNGQVLFGESEEGVSHYWVYTPGSGPISQGKPTINSVYETSCGVYHATGKLFNGISEGAGFGDDWQMETNYPIIRLTNGTNTYYAKTTNWNRIGAVQTDSLEDSVQFTLPSIPAGTYSLVVTANGFASNPALFTPFEGTAIAASNVVCHGNSTGNASASVAGGSSPYTYHWSNGNTNVSTGPVLSAGTYTLTVTDNSGCTVTSTVTITQPGLFSVGKHINKQVSCHNGNDGNVTALPSGGISPYTYSWTGGGTTVNYTGLTAGIYIVTVTDKNGCTATTSVTITQPSTAISLSQGSQPTTIGNCQGTAWVTASGGTPGYSFSWSPGGATTDTAHLLCAGNYCCKVTDKNGCIDSVCITITTGIQGISNSSLFNVYPDPNNGTFYIESSISYNKSILEIDNVLGQEVLRTGLTGIKNKLNLTEQPSGVYIYKVYSEDGMLLGNGKIAIQK